MNKKNGFQQDPALELGNLAEDAGRASAIQTAIAPTTRRMVLQYHALLRQELEREVTRVMQEFEVAAADMEDAIAKQVEASLALIQQQVYRVFKDSLSNVEVSLADPILPARGGRKLRSTGRQSPPQSDGHAPGEPVESDPVPAQEDDQPQVEIERSELNGSHGAPSAHRAPLAVAELDQTAEPTESITSAVHLEAPNDQSPFLPKNGVGTAEEPSNGGRPVALADDPEDEVYEGMVRLSVEANQSSRQVVQFVRELRQKPQFRLLRMAGSHKEGVDIWVGLREPLCLKKILPQIQVVSQVSDPAADSPPGQERALKVRLIEDPSPHTPTSVNEAESLDTVEPVLA